MVLDPVYQKHLNGEISRKVKGKSVVEGKAIVAGEIYMLKQHLLQSQRQSDRLNDEIEELSKFDVDSELEEHAEI